jgi:MerR family transcriptional regulator, light-induced transcriptional regulator
MNNPQPGEAMETGASGRITIGAVARRTGLSPHLLRAWERRYGVVEPTRTEGGDRLYTAADVRRLQLLARAVGAGHPIGRLAAMSPEELAAVVGDEAGSPARSNGPPGPGGTESFTAECMAAVEAMDGGRVNAVLTKAVVTLGISGFSEWLTAVLRGVGDQWEVGEICPAHEHLLTANAQRVLGWLLLTIPVAAGAPGVVVSTPAGHRHELAALLAAVEAATAGWRVTYLGPDLPAADIARGVFATEASAVALSVVRETREQELATEVASLRAAVPVGLPILVGGAGALANREALASAGATFLPDFAAFRSTLRSIAEVG